MSRLSVGITAAALALTTALGATAQQQGLPGPLREVAFDQRIGERLPLDALFRDHTGESGTLEGFLDGRPAVLALVYYDCPMLCGLVLNGLITSLKAVSFDPGNEFQVVVVSFDPQEGPAQAADIRRGALSRYGRNGTEAGWTFLTGEPEAISRLTEAVGFRYAFDEASGEFAHAAGIVLTTPGGSIARYFYGIEYSPRDLRLGLVEAAEEKLGTVVDQVFLYCYRYDPETGTYSAVTMNLVRLGGLVTLLVLGLFLTISLRRERRLKSA